MSVTGQAVKDGMTSQGSKVTAAIGRGTGTSLTGERMLIETLHPGRRDLQTVKANYRRSRCTTMRHRLRTATSLMASTKPLMVWRRTGKALLTHCYCFLFRTAQMGYLLFIMALISKGYIKGIHPILTIQYPQTS